MSWYYAESGKQVGPVTDTDFEALVLNGTVGDGTLVWKEGMANWQPYGQVQPRQATVLPAPPLMSGAAGATGAPPVAGPGPGEVVCAECGRICAQDNAIQYGTAWVCATCKPVFLQKLREGAAPGGVAPGAPGAPFDPDAFLASLRESDYTVEIGDCLSRAWNLVTSHFWISVGVVLLCYVSLFAVGVVPCVGPIVQIVLQGPILGGVYWFFLKMIRHRDASVADAFAGFSTALVPLFLVALISGLLTFACVLPGVMGLVAVRALRMHVPVSVIIGALAVGVIPAVYLAVGWMFSMPLVIDKRLGFWTAMELSRKVVTMHWGSLFLLLIVGGLISMLGLLAFCIGFFVAAAVMMAALTYAYEDIFGEGRTRIP